MTDEKKAILHICRTGAKTQFYTLYVERIEPHPWRGRLHTCRYQQNLAFDLSDAMENAEKWIDETDLRNRYTVEIQHHTEPRPIYATMTAFGADFKMNKRRTHWWANANEDFWAQWKAQKPEIKAAGYWVKNMEGTWLIFKRIDAGEMDFVKDKPPTKPTGIPTTPKPAQPRPSDPVPAPERPAPTPEPAPPKSHPHRWRPMSPWFCVACDEECLPKHTKHTHPSVEGSICLECVNFYRSGGAQ